MKFTCNHVERCLQVLSDADNLGVATQEHGCMPWRVSAPQLSFVDGDSRNLLLQPDDNHIIKWFRPNDQLDHVRSYQNDKAALTLLRRHGMDVPKIVACCDQHSFFVMERLSGRSLLTFIRDLEDQEQVRYLRQLCSAHRQADQHLRELRNPPQPDPHHFQ